MWPLVTCFQDKLVEVYFGFEEDWGDSSYIGYIVHLSVQMFKQGDSSRRQKMDGCFF